MASAGIREPEFPRTTRFEAVRHLGCGGFGIVYEAFDREWNTSIAIKVLRRQREQSFVQFKREFRTLADVRHPNLVALHQLFMDELDTYFTMEFLRGQPFCAAFRSRSDPSVPPVLPNTPWGATEGSTFSEFVVQPTSSVGRPLDLLDIEATSRLPSALRQLAEGLRHLHQMGLVHRDIKPSNVIATTEGRIVIVDFGLVEDTRSVVAVDSSSARVLGTPGYLAPEQRESSQVSAASDWWAVGAILAETLIGDRDPENALNQSTPRTVRALLELSRALLAARPERRAGYDEIVRCLDEIDGVRMASRAAPVRVLPLRFVGRAAERAIVERAVAALDTGHGGWVRVRGHAGFGKSALLSEVIARVSTREPAMWVFSTTCRDRELVPFRAVDALMDQLSVALTAAPELVEDISRISGIGVLATIFRTLPLRSSWTRSTAAQSLDAFDLRRRAFRAWRDMMAYLATRRKIVLVIDDAHWGDADSASLLAGLVEKPAPIVVLVAHREHHESQFLTTLERAMSERLQLWTDVELTPMDGNQARELAAQLLFERPGDALRIDEIVRQSSGVPLFLVTLATAPTDLSDVELSFEQIVSRRLARLPPSATRLLETAALSPEPIAEDLLLAAVGTLADAHECLVALDVERLLIRRPSTAGRLLEPFHDRVRQAVLRALAPEETCARHHELARALESSAGDEPRSDLLFVHYAGAGEAALAAIHGELAGERALKQMAFDRAGTIFDQAARSTQDPERRRRLRERSIDALAAAGHTTAAARAYYALAEEHDDARGRVLQRKAAEAFLVTGHHEIGLRIWQDAAAQVGLGFPAGTLDAAIAAVKGTLAVRFPWLAHRLGAAREASMACARSDIALAAAKGLIASDPLRGVVFGLQSLANARRSGSTEQLVFSLSFVAAACLAAAGGISRKWAMSMLEEADRIIAARGGNDYLLGVVMIARAQIAMFEGRWSEAAAAAEIGLNALVADGHARVWETNLSRQARLRSLEELGQIEPMMREANDWLERSRTYEDVFGEVTAHLTLGVGALAAGTNETAEAHAALAEERWVDSGYSVQRFYAARIRILAALQRGDRLAALALLEHTSARVRSSMIFRIPTGRIDLLWMEARVALAVSEASQMCRTGTLRRVARLATQLACEDHIPARAHAAFLRARVADVKGRSKEVDHHIGTAHRLYGDCGMVPMQLLVEMLRDSGSARGANAERLRALGFVDPARWASSHGVRYANTENDSAAAK